MVEQVEVEVERFSLLSEREVKEKVLTEQAEQRLRAAAVGAEAEADRVAKTKSIKIRLNLPVLRSMASWNRWRSRG